MNPLAVITDFLAGACQPSILRKRYPKDDRSTDRQVAYCVARWLTETDERQFLARYFDPPLTTEERKIANLEGWMLGIM